MKKIYAMLLIIMLILSFNVASANTINSIKMDIYVDEIGNAQVTEIWDCYATKNTEWYHTYDNLGKSKITNFTVKDENNIVYENVNNWNVNGSFNNKTTFRLGISTQADADFVVVTIYFLSLALSFSSVETADV